jgi:hypothetical protein
MISEGLRLFLAEERQPLLIRHVVLAFALIPIPWFRTGLVDFVVVSSTIPSPAGPSFAFAFLIFLSVLSLPLVPLFLAWSLPGAHRPGLPRRSIIFLALLIAYQPLGFNLEGIFYGEETRAYVARMQERFPIVWLFKHLDTALLLALVVWATVRRADVQPREKEWFHWLLFICALWAICAFYDPFLGFALSFFDGWP